MRLEERVKLARLIVALADDDKEAVVKAYTDMGFRTAKMGERGIGGGFTRTRVVLSGLSVPPCGESVATWSSVMVCFFVVRATDGCSPAGLCCSDMEQRECHQCFVCLFGDVPCHACALSALLSAMYSTFHSTVRDDDAWQNALNVLVPSTVGASWLSVGIVHCGLLEMAACMSIFLYSCVLCVPFLYVLDRGLLVGWWLNVLCLCLCINSIFFTKLA